MESNKPVEYDDEYPFASIIIPMYNSEETIERCLDSLVNLSYPKDRYEIIVVDDGSTDRSRELAEKYSVKIVDNDGGTIAAVRNSGTKVAVGDIFCFVDSDCEVYESWLESAVNQLSSHEKNGATGTGYITPLESTWIEKAWLYESNHLPFETDFIPCGNFIVKSRVFNELNGFNEKLTTCEDADICARIKRNNYRVINDSSIKSIHLRNPKTLIAFMKKEFWYGINMTDTDLPFFHDKVYLSSALFFVFHIIALLGIMNFMFGNGTGLVTVSLSVICLLVFASTLYRLKRSKKYRLFFQISVLFYCFFISRSFAMVSKRIKKMKSFARGYL